MAAPDKLLHSLTTRFEVSFSQAFVVSIIVVARIYRQFRDLALSIKRVDVDVRPLRAYFVGHIVNVHEPHSDFPSFRSLCGGVFLHQEHRFNYAAHPDALEIEICLQTWSQKVPNIFKGYCRCCRVHQSLLRGFIFRLHMGRHEVEKNTQVTHFSVFLKGRSLILVVMRQHARKLIRMMCQDGKWFRNDDGFTNQVLTGSKCYMTKSNAKKFHYN